LRKSALIALLSAVFFFMGAAHAQQFDASFGLSTVTAPSAFDATGNFFPQSVGGGVWPSFSADFLLFHYFGFGGEVAWRAKRNISQGFLPFRPIFYDFNAVFAPPIGKHAAADLEGGLGGESIRFYQPFVTCSFFSCTDFVSSNHLLGHIGGGIKLYAFHGFFVKPEAHFYFIRHNFEFSGDHATRLGVSIGYSSGR